MTDPNTISEAVERLATLEHDIMLMCGTCPEECNFHPPSDMWIVRATGALICDDCADDAEIPAEDLDHAPDPVRILRELSARLTDAEAAIKRQSAAARTIQQTTAMIAQNENERLRQIDRSEYTAAATLDSERAANARLTAELEAAEAERDRLREALEQSEAHVDSCKLQVKTLYATMGRICAILDGPIEDKACAIRRQCKPALAGGEA